MRLTAMQLTHFWTTAAAYHLLPVLGRCRPLRGATRGAGGHSATMSLSSTSNSFKRYTCHR